MFFLTKKLQHTVESQWSSVDGDEEEAMEALHLRRTAQKVLSRAHILSDLKSSSYEDSVRSPSVVSRRLDPSDRNETANIEVWIEQLIRAEDETSSATLPVLPMASSTSSTEIDRHSSHKIAVHTEDDDDEEDEFNPEEDFDLDLMLALSKAGKKHYHNANPEQAAENLHLALQYATKLSPSRYLKQDLTEERLILGTICTQKRDLENAEEHLSTLIRESVATQGNRGMINDAHLKLARVYHMKKAYEDALQHCQKCLHARTKIYGKNSKEYFEAVQLLVLIYSSKGSHLEADVMLEKLPDDLREETELQLQTTAPLGPLPTSPPLSPRPVASNSARAKPTRTIFEFRKQPSMDRSMDRGPSFSPPMSLGVDMTDSASSNDLSMPRHNSNAKDHDPNKVLTQAGFTGDFDSAKALNWAIVNGDLKLVHYLLEGYTVRKSRKSKFSLSPSDTNTSGSDIVIKKARVDGPGKSKFPTPLLTSIEHGRVMIAKILLDRNASTSLKDEFGRSPLRLAAERGNAEIVKLLLTKNAWIESPYSASNSAAGREKEFRAYTPLHGAAANGHEEIAHALLAAGSAIDARDTHGATALKHACQRGQTGVARLLLHEGASVTAADDAGFTPLMAAAYNGHEPMVRLLKNAAISSNNSTNTNTDAIAPASSSSSPPPPSSPPPVQPPFLSTFTNTPNLVGQTSLILASEQGHEGTCKLLLSAGASLEQQDNAGWTALISAANKGHLGTVLLLLGAGANINAQSNLGSTALDRAEYRNDRRLAGALRENGAGNGTRKMEKVSMTAFTGYTL